MRWVGLSTVLLASAASALHAQDISLSGSANAGVVYDSGAADGEFSSEAEVDFVISGAGASDGGLAFGAVLGLDETGLDDAEVFLSGSFGTLRMGTLDPATDGFGIADPGFSGLGLDDVAEQYKNATAGADVAYSFSRAGFTLIATAEIGDESSLGVAAEYDSGAFSLGLGYVDDADAENSSVSVTAGYSLGPVAVRGLYSDWSEGGEGYGVDVSVDAGPGTVTAVWARAAGAEVDEDDGDLLGEAYGIGVTMPLSDGLTLSGGLGVIEPEAPAEDARTVADFGVTMSF
ncbi:MAG: porin [Paracoccaceae bacterium]|nr:porin [Paracoccaceae bacterium]